MTRICVPSKGPESWQLLLADPKKHWQPGFSAMTLAHAWESADGLPPEISRLFEGRVELLLGLPEHKVDLPGGARPSQTDLFALLRHNDRVIATAVEGKADETFGPTVGQWLEDASDGKRKRLEYLCGVLGLINEGLSELRYQLLHRAASAAIEFGTIQNGRGRDDRSFVLTDELLVRTRTQRSRNAWALQRKWVASLRQPYPVGGFSILPGRPATPISGQRERRSRPTLPRA